MTDRYQHVTLNQDGEAEWFSADLTTRKMHLRLWANGERRLAWRDHDTDLAWLQTPRGLAQLGTAKCKGVFPIAFHPVTGDVYVQHEPGDGYLDVYDGNGVGIGAEPCEYQAQGIHSIRNGRVVMHRSAELDRKCGDETWVDCTETASFIVGAFGRDPDFGASISMLDKRTGKVTRWLGETVSPVSAVEDKHGALFVAICGKNPPAPDAVPWADAFPPIEEPVKPIPDLLTEDDIHQWQPHGPGIGIEDLEKPPALPVEKPKPKRPKWVPAWLWEYFLGRV